MTVRVFFDPRRVEQLRKQGINPRRQLTSGPAPEARTSLELVEECARLRAEVDRLRRDNQRLSDEVARLTAPGSSRREDHELDASAQRFALLELE